MYAYVKTPEEIELVYLEVAVQHLQHGDSTTLH